MGLRRVRPSGRPSDIVAKFRVCLSHGVRVKGIYSTLALTLTAAQFNDVASDGAVRAAFCKSKCGGASTFSHDRGTRDRRREEIQGDPSGSSPCFVDIRTKVAFQYMLLKLKFNLCLDVNNT